MEPMKFRQAYSSDLDKIHERLEKLEGNTVPNEMVKKALDTLLDIMNDENSAASARLEAAQTILDFSFSS